MARPLPFPTIQSFTPNGIPFQWLTDGYEDRAAADANEVVIQALVAWQVADAFVQEAVGFTTWDGSSPTLQRTVPFPCPTRDGLWCDTCEQVKMGAYEYRTDWNDPLNGNIFSQDWIIYRLTFRRPKYWVRTDFTLAMAYKNLEQNRYVKRERVYTPRERRISGAAFEYYGADNTWKVIAEESGFLPDYRIDYALTWCQIPIEAVPESTWANQILTVNNNQFGLGYGSESADIYSPGRLLFKGPRDRIESYLSASGDFVCDVTLVFSYQPGGWNNYLAPERTGPDKNIPDYRPIRRRGASGNQPPYASSDFQKLFRPGAP